MNSWICVLVVTVGEECSRQQSVPTDTPPSLFRYH